MKPIALDEAHIAPDLLAKERAIFKAQVIESGKPAEIADKIVDGKINKFLRESTLIQQAFIKDQDQSVGSYVASQKTAIVSFLRLELGEDSPQ